MSISVIEKRMPVARSVAITSDALTVPLSDGRTIIVPTGWFPRLVHATPDERADWRLIGQGEGIHWTALDEDISVEHLLAGKPSYESQASLKKWLEARPGARLPKLKRPSGRR